MIVADQFTLLKGVPNILNVSRVALNPVPKGEVFVQSMLNLIENRVNHFSKNRVYKFIESPKDLKRIVVSSMSNYPLPITYNKKTDSIVINLHSFGVDDLSRIEALNVYASIAYGICFSDLITGKKKIPNQYHTPITNFLMTMFMRLFGKEYGLLAIYSTEIPKLKFLVSCYIQQSFFGITGRKQYLNATAASGFDFRPIEEELKKYNFENIDVLIQALSDLRVMPGINRYRFADKVLKHLTLNFVPALEDLSRFISTIMVIDMTGSTLLPTFIKKAYNEQEFGKIIDLTRNILR